MTDIDLDAITERAKTATPGLVLDARTLADWQRVGEVDVRRIAESAADVPALVAEVCRLTAALAAEKREHGHDASLLTHMTKMYKEEVARAERAEGDALAQRSIATREAQERREHQVRADRQAAALREVAALHPRGETSYPPGEGLVSDPDDYIEDGCQACHEPWPCPTAAAVARAEQAGSTDEPECTCEHYVVDRSDPEPYHPENVDVERDPACPIHGAATVRLTVLVTGNKTGYYTDVDEMGERLREWVDGALNDRDDIDSWTIHVDQMGADRG